MWATDLNFILSKVCNNSIELVLTDLDGTLLNDDRKVSDVNRNVLEKLGEQGVRRAIATGRNLHSFRKAIDEGFPIDYLIFSSGAGIMDWKAQRLLYKKTLLKSLAQSCCLKLIEAGVSFMLLDQVQNSHHFSYWTNGEMTEDFGRRLSLYAPWARRIHAVEQVHEASQILVILPSCEQRFVELSQEMHGANVIRSTSPLDHKSIWMEVFPLDVSKSAAGRFLCAHLGLHPQDAMSVGNDYNDVDLLEYTGSSYMVANAPAELAKMFKPTESNNQDGFARAVWREGLVGWQGAKR